MTTSIGRDTQQEMAFVLKVFSRFIQEPRIPSVSIFTVSGRRYQVYYVRESSPNVWERVTAINGYLRCSDCPRLLVPGSEWIQITLKNGNRSEPFVRMQNTIYHDLENHPERVQALAVTQEYRKVFGGIEAS